MDKQLLGAFIAERRKQQGMSQAALAQALHVTDKAVSKWERGISFSDISMLIPISKVLEISLYDLLTGGEEDEPE